MQLTHDEITRLSPDERLALIAQLWDSLATIQLLKAKSEGFVDLFSIVALASREQRYTPNLSQAAKQVMRARPKRYITYTSNPNATRRRLPGDRGPATLA